VLLQFASDLSAVEELLTDLREFFLWDRNRIEMRHSNENGVDIENYHDMQEAVTTHTHFKYKNSRKIPSR
jgi:hypothetical protein